MTRTEHVGVYLKLNKAADGDVIDRLQKQKNRQGYIKDLIRTDIDLDLFRNGVQNGVIKIETDKAKDNDHAD